MLRRTLALGALILGLLLAPTAAQALTKAQLASGLSTRTAKLGSRSGALVRDLTTGETLFERRRGISLAPASNQKLFTTASALLNWGSDARLVTELRAARVPDARGVIAGNVVLVGAGDPSLNDDALRNLAADVSKAGVKKITGRIVGDESYLDTRRGSYDTGYSPDSELGGWLGGLVWGHGRVGTYGPAVTAAARLKLFLKQRGITVAKAERAGAAGNAKETIGAVSSPRIVDLAATTLVPSDNFYAEMLLKDQGRAFGTAGTSPEGARVVKATLAREVGIHPAIVDGSGLSRSNRTSPSQIVTLLTEMAKRPEGPGWRNAMPQPGRTGTLYARMRGTAAVTRCRAKTGTLREVSALSGYCTVPGGHVLAFSFLENDVDPYYAKAIEDQMVPLIATYTPAGR
jgi:serine-type D-Ala-D-Ala carboxypeptidase/endopeptidase (penicillin-binding protein 4)